MCLCYKLHIFINIHIGYIGRIFNALINIEKIFLPYFTIINRILKQNFSFNYAIKVYKNYLYYVKIIIYTK